MRVAQWGNSLGVRLPAAVVETLQLKAGDEIEISVAGPRDMRVARKPGALEALQSLRRLRGAMPADFHFDRDDANAR